MSNAVDEARARRSTGFARHLRVSFGVSLALMCFVLAGCPGRQLGPAQTRAAADYRRRRGAARRRRRAALSDPPAAAAGRLAGHLVPSAATPSAPSSPAYRESTTSFPGARASASSKAMPTGQAAHRIRGHRGLAGGSACSSTGRQDVDGVTVARPGGAPTHKDPVWINRARRPRCTAADCNHRFRRCGRLPDAGSCSADAAATARGVAQDRAPRPS